MSFYPKIAVEPLQVALRSIEADPGYLTSDECTYDEKTKAFLAGLSHGMVDGQSPDLFEGEREDVAIDRQIQILINDLESFAKTLKSGDHSEKLAYFKTKSALLEKLIGMRERVSNLREVSEFRGMILAFLDEVCTKDQISDLMNRLDGVLE